MERIGVILVAGGSGHRMGSTLPKQFKLLDGQPLLARTINRFAEALADAEIVVVLPSHYADFWHDLAARFDIAPHSVVCGGEERFHSVRNGLEALKTDPELIAVHDGVRPLASVELIRRVRDDAALFGAAIPVVEVVDSLRQVEGKRSHPIDRSPLRAVQTPQFFRADWLRKGYQQAYTTAFTDDASVVEAAGYDIHLSEGERMNLKITTPEDLSLAQAWLDYTKKEAEEKAEENNGAYL